MNLSLPYILRMHVANSSPKWTYDQNTKMEKPLVGGQRLTISGNTTTINTEIMNSWVKFYSEQEF